MKRLIVVEGLSGSGKSTFSKMLANTLNVEYVNLDEIAKTCYDEERIIEKLREIFPVSVFKDDKVDFRKIGEIVFNDKKKLTVLEGFLYPVLVNKVNDIFEKSMNGCILDGIKVHGTELFDRADYKIYVERNNNARIESLIKRDNISKDQAKKRDNAISFEGIEFDCNINNDGSLDDLKNQIPLVVSKIFRGNYCLYAGSFDPLTNGHMALIKQVSKDYDCVFVGIGDNPNKKRNYDKDTMRDLINEVFKEEGISNAICFGYKGYTGEIANKLGVSTLIRGVRNEKDAREEKVIEEYNFKHYSLKTKYYEIKGMSHISSSFVRKKVKENKPISDLVPHLIEKYILKMR